MSSFLNVEDQWLFTHMLCSSRKPYWEIFASKTLNIRKEVNPSFCFAVLILISENFQIADHVWNHPIMHCKPLVIDYVMYAFVLFFWHARDLLTFILRPATIFYQYYQYLLAPFIKKWPLKQVFRGHFGPQVKISGWNTGSVPTPSTHQFLQSSASFSATMSLSHKQHLDTRTERYCKIQYK